MALMDTSAIIDLGKGKKGVKEISESAERRGEALKISAISIFELAAGLPAGIDEKRKKMLELFQTVQLNNAQAERGALIYRQLRDRGEDIGSFDSIIAGVALVEDEPLITANVKHFARVEGLRLITY